MFTEVSDIDLSRNLTKLLNQVETSSTSVLIRKDGKPVAALVDAELFARINRVRDRFDGLRSRIAEDYAQTPIEMGLAEIDAVVAAQRAQ
jgi:prevent-host-death family protein